MDSRSIAGWICVPNLSTLEISSSVLLCPEVASVPVSGRVHPLLAAAEHLEALLPSSLAGQLLEGGGSGVGAGILPPWLLLGVPLQGTLLSSHYCVHMPCHALCKLSPLLSGEGRCSGGRRRWGLWSLLGGEWETGP